MNVVRLLGVAAVVALAGAGTRADDTVDYAKLLVGKWEATKADPGTVPAGSVLEFTKDGKLKITAKKADAEVSLDGTYKVEKDTFVMTVKVGDQERTQTITMTKISDKEMSTKDKDGKVVEFTKKK